MKHAGLAAIGCAGLFLVLVLASYRVWEPTHDEGGTWLQVFGRLDVPRWPEVAPIEDLYGSLEGERPRSASEVVSGMSTGQAMHPPAYYLLLHAWAGSVGGSSLSLRWPGYLVSVLTLLALYRIAGWLIPRDGANAWAMLLLSVSPWFITFSNLARPYGIALCVAVAAQLCVLSMYRPNARPRTRIGWGIAFGALSLLGIYLVYHYVFAFVWQLAQLVVLAGLTPGASMRRWLRALALGLGIGLAVAIGYAPWLPRLQGHLELTSGGRFYFGGPSTGDWLGSASTMLASFSLAEALRSPAAPWLLLALLVLTSATLALPLWELLRGPSGSERERQFELPARVFWLSAPLLPGLILAADAWHGTHTFFFTKTSFSIMPILVLAIVRAWASVRSRGLYLAGLVAWALLLVTATTADIAQRGDARLPYEAAADLIAQHDEEPHLVVVSSVRPGLLTPFVLSLRDAGVRHARVAVAESYKLPRLVREEAALARYSSITLVGFDVWADGESGAAWGFRSAALDRAARAGSDAGFRVELPGPSGIPAVAKKQSVRPTLRVLGPLRGKFLEL